MLAVKICCSGLHVLTQHIDIVIDHSVLLSLVSVHSLVVGPVGCGMTHGVVGFC